jgi:hypothetical protein
MKCTGFLFDDEPILEGEEKPKEPEPKPPIIHP